MPDIGMCDNESCPLKQRCYRFMATPTQPYQWYQAYAPYQAYGAWVCEGYMALHNRGHAQSPHPTPRR